MITLIKTDSDGNSETLKFKVDSAVRGEFANTVPLHPAESGFSVSDHVSHEMDKVTVTIVLGVIGDVSVNEGYTFLKDARDDGSIVHVNLNYYDLRIFSETVIEVLGVVVGERILTCTVVFSEIRRATLETKLIDVVQDTDGSILYYPVGEAPATESLDGTAEMTPEEAYDTVTEIIAKSEEEALSDSAAEQSFSFSSMPFNVMKKISIMFSDGTRRSVIFLFHAMSDYDDRSQLEVYWQTGECPISAGVHRCYGFNGVVSRSSTIKVNDMGGGLEFTAFIRGFDIATSPGILKRKYLTANIWIYDHAALHSL